MAKAAIAFPAARKVHGGVRLAMLASTALAGVLAAAPAGACGDVLAGTWTCTGPGVLSSKTDKSAAGELTLQLTGSPGVTVESGPTIKLSGPSDPSRSVPLNTTAAGDLKTNDPNGTAIESYASGAGTSTAATGPGNSSGAGGDQAHGKDEKVTPDVDGTMAVPSQPGIPTGAKAGEIDIATGGQSDAKAQGVSAILADSAGGVSIDGGAAEWRRR